MSTTRVDGGEWALGNVGKPSPATKPKRQMVGDETTPAQLDDAVAYLSKGDKANKQAAAAVKVLASAVRHGLAGGLTKRALLLLVQDLTPKQRNGSQLGLETIEGVITALANLDQHVAGNVNGEG